MSFPFLEVVYQLMSLYYTSTEQKRNSCLLRLMIYGILIHVRSLLSPSKESHRMVRFPVLCMLCLFSGVVLLLSCLMVFSFLLKYKTCFSYHSWTKAKQNVNSAPDRIISNDIKEALGCLKWCKTTKKKEKNTSGKFNHAAHLTLLHPNQVTRTLHLVK